MPEGFGAPTARLAWLQSCVEHSPWISSTLARKFDTFEKQPLDREAHLSPRNWTEAALALMRSRTAPRLRAELHLRYESEEARADVVSHSLPDDGEGKLSGMRAILLDAMRSCAVLRPVPGRRRQGRNLRPICEGHRDVKRHRS